jgi:hypothetical protein
MKRDVSSFGTGAPEPLDYGRPAAPDRRQVILAALLGGGAGVLLDMVIVGGAIYGDIPGVLTDAMGRILFPYWWLAASHIGYSSGAVLLLLGCALVQFPFYGAACGAAVAGGSFWKMVASFAAIHLIAVVACFVF